MTDGSATAKQQKIRAVMRWIMAAFYAVAGVGHVLHPEPFLAILPGWVPLVGVDLGDTNVVPVDYVAKAMDHIAHQPDLDGQAFHLVNPEPLSTVGLVNSFASAAKAPQFAVPVDRTITS